VTAAKKILLVEDTPFEARTVMTILKGESLSISHAETLADARLRILAEKPAVMLLDLNLPDGEGFELLRELQDLPTAPTIVVITGQGSIAVAVAAIKAGAHDFLVKPVSKERLITTVRNAIERQRLREIAHTFRDEIALERFEGFVGSCPSMQFVYRRVRRAAQSRAPVFITGESGTGKEVCAQAIHRQSSRAQQPFIALNCGALPKDLIESELFGHVRGAFTGSTASRDGAALSADGGTLFLDEIGELDALLQVKLLRFVQEGEIRAVGSDTVRHVDVRLVCATNRDPQAEIAANRLREDLFWRLNVLPIHLPPLRERGDDVLQLSHHILREVGQEEGRWVAGFDAESEQALLNHSWPGNVRELQNVLRNAVVLNDGDTITREMLTIVGERSVTTPSNDAAFVSSEIRPLRLIEEEVIARAISLCDGNITKAANLLGINPSTIHRRRKA
jgi:DNA-binding NtrC family response regulator